MVERILNNMALRLEEQGAILVIAEKKEAYTFLKSALEQTYREILHAAGMSEAKTRIGSEKVCMVFIFTPLSTGNGVEEAKEFIDRRGIPSVIIAGNDIYPEIVYRTQGRQIFVLTYPAKKGLILQTANILCECQRQLKRVMAERDRLQEKLADMSVINRAKLCLIERRQLKEDEAHHYIEKLAMDKGLTKRKAAELVLEELK